MKKRGKREAGFSIVTAMIAIVIIAGLAGVGYAVYQHNRVQLSNAAPNPNQPTTSQQTTTTSPSMTNQSTVQIPELGIQITVPNDLKDLTYQVKTVTLRGQPATIAFFSTKSLASAVPTCSAASSPLGSLERVDQQYPSDDPMAAFYYGQLIKQFPTFFISAGFPNAACSTNPSTANSAAQHESEFAKAELSIQALN